MAAPGAAEQRWAGLADTLFKHIVVPEALGGGAFAQDAHGFLWVGTQAGLARWDGYRLRAMPMDPQNPVALPDSFIHALHVDERGRLWVGTQSGGLARYDARRDNFEVIRAGPSGLSSAEVRAIADDGQGGLWVGTELGLDHLDAKGAVQQGLFGAAQPPRPAAAVLSLLADREGALWIGTRLGLWRRERGKPDFAAVPLHTPGDAQPAVSALFQDSAGRVWVGTRSHGALVVDKGTARARAVHESGPAPALQSEVVLAIIEAVPGEIWLGTYGGGIVVVDAASGATRRIRHRADMPSSLSDNDVTALFRDRSGLVWVGTNLAMSQHDPQQRAVLTLFGAPGPANALTHSNVPSVMSAPDGRIWLGLGGGGVDIVDPVSGRVGQIRPDPAHPETALPKGRVLAMAVGPNGNVYIGTPQGLYRADARGRRLVRVTVPGRGPTAEVWALCQDAGVLWIGGLDGLWALNLGAEPASNPTPGRGVANVTALARGRGDSLWVGTRAGLEHLNTATGLVDKVPSDPADATRLPGGLVSAVLVDPTGRLWVASFGIGVQVQVPGHATGGLRFRRLGAREGLPNAAIDMLLDDGRGQVWASTDDGLAVIDQGSLSIRKLQRPDGLAIASYWTNAGAVTAAGELLFGGLGGLTVVRPDRLTRWIYRPPVVVTDARIGAQPLAPGQLNGTPDAAAPFEISPDDRGLWVEFAALDYSAPERNRYAYRLNGFDKDWITADPTRRLASYTNLPPGTYTLELRGSNREGEWSEAAVQLPISVQPAWHQTGWFRGLGALCALGLVGGLVQVRTVYLRRRQRELKALVAERTAELERRSEELRDSQRQLESIAYADSLTGLPNRRRFNEELRHQVAQARRDGRLFALLVIDLDGFKNINDTQGHDAGDALLVETAGRLTRAVRDVDRAARLGGDEFAVLLGPVTEPDTVDLVCRRIVDSLSEPMSFSGAQMQVGASIGVALCPGHGLDANTVYKAADLALYDAKRSGRNTWRWHRPDALNARPKA